MMIYEFRWGEKLFKLLHKVGRDKMSIVGKKWQYDLAKGQLDLELVMSLPRC